MPVKQIPMGIGNSVLYERFEMSEITKIGNLTENNEQEGGMRELLSSTGYSDKAIDFYMDKAYMGELSDANHISEMVGSCGDTMKVFLKIDGGIIEDVSFQVLGCPGAVSSAMAAGFLVKGKDVDYAKSINDNDVFKELEEIPAKKHHCIQLSVKTLHKAIDEYSQVKKAS